MAASLMVTGTALAEAPASGPPTADGPTAAGYGAAWLAARIEADGLPFQAFGGPQWGATVEAGLALAATGVGAEQLDALVNAVADNVEQIVDPAGDAGPDGAGELAKVILLAEASGSDPRSFGPAPGVDLVARLQATLRTDGPDAGLFGASDPTFDGAYRQGLALAALSAAGVTAEDAAVDWLLTQQCPDGSWFPYRADPSSDCVRQGFIGPESNATALAIIGLTAARPGPAIGAGLNWLDSVQNDDGGWGFLAGDPTEPNSTAVALQAIITAGAATQDRFDGALEALLSFQLGCDVPAQDRGAFTFPGMGSEPNLFATVQAVTAAAGSPLPVVPVEQLAELPVIDCDGTAPTITTPSTTAPSTTSPTTTSPAPATTTTMVDVVQATDQPTQVLGTADSTGTASGVAASGSASGSLASTGADPASHALVGFALSAVGLVMLGFAVLARRRQALR